MLLWFLLRVLVEVGLIAMPLQLAEAMQRSGLSLRAGSTALDAGAVRPDLHTQNRGTEGNEETRDEIPRGQRNSKHTNFESDQPRIALHAPALLAVTMLQSLACCRSRTLHPKPRKQTLNNIGNNPLDNSSTRVGARRREAGPSGCWGTGAQKWWPWIRRTWM